MRRAPTIAALVGVALAFAPAGAESAEPCTTKACFAQKRHVGIGVPSTQPVVSSPIGLGARR